MTIPELEELLKEKGVPQRYYALDGKEHVQRNRAIRKKLSPIRKKFLYYEVYSIWFGQDCFIERFETESEACERLYHKVIKDCLYDGVKLNGIPPIKYKKPLVAPKWLHEMMAHDAKIFGINVTYTRDIHSITFPTGCKFETKYYFQDVFYKGNAIICLRDNNFNYGHENNINVIDNVFMINDRCEIIWKFKRGFFARNKYIPVDHTGVDYNEDMLFLYIYYKPKKHYDCGQQRINIDLLTGKQISERKYNRKYMDNTKW